jgi:ABC-type arginine transport system ATPase subunit
MCMFYLAGIPCRVCLIQGKDNGDSCEVESVVFVVMPSFHVKYRRPSLPVLHMRWSQVFQRFPGHSNGKRVQKFSIVRINMTSCNEIYFSQDYLATDPEARVRFPALPEKKVLGLERGPLSLVSTTEELLYRKVASRV